MPKVSVILPAYNAGAYIEEAIRSILNQTFPDFELIIINDCSTDNTQLLLEKFTDPRICLVQNDTNLKVVETLNKGLKMAKGEYIARMDADDISHPGRFKKQVAFLDANTGIDVCGTWVQTIGGENNVLRAATTHEHIKVRLFFLNPIIHPSVMMRSSSFRQHNLVYDNHYKNAEDYGLWVRAIDKLRFANLPEVLLKYRIHDANVSVFKESNKDLLDEIHYYIYAYFLNKLKLEYTEHDLLIHRKLGMVDVGRLEPSELAEYLLWLKRLALRNNEVAWFNKEYFRDVILSYVFYLFKQTSPSMPAFRESYKILGNLYNLNDYAKYFFSRAKVKLHYVERF